MNILQLLASLKRKGNPISPAATTAHGMNPAYFDTQFECAQELTSWPNKFAIITAFATTGENWPDAENQAGDARLEAHLREQGLWVRRITGFSPTTGHREPGWAVYLGIKTACEIGLRFKQDAIYYVAGDILSVSFTDSRRALVRIGSFRQRVNRAD